MPWESHRQIYKNYSFKYLGQYCSNKYALAKERMLIAQVLLIKMSLRYHQVIWSEYRVETLEQAPSASYINSTKEQVIWSSQRSCLE